MEGTINDKYILVVNRNGSYYVVNNEGKLITMKRWLENFSEEGKGTTFRSEEALNNWLNSHTEFNHKERKILRVGELYNDSCLTTDDLFEKFTALHPYVDVAPYLIIKYTDLYNSYELKQNDLLHMIENDCVAEDEMCKFTEMLRDVRVQRRRCKNAIAVLEVLKDCGAVLKNISAPTYRPREIKDLT